MFVSPVIEPVLICLSRVVFDLASCIGVENGVDICVYSFSLAPAQCFINVAISVVSFCAINKA